MSWTSTFHSAGASRARLPRLPMRTSWSSISTIGHAPQSGQSDTLLDMLLTSFPGSSVTRCFGRRRGRAALDHVFLVSPYVHTYTLPREGDFIPTVPRTVGTAES